MAVSLKGTMEEVSKLSVPSCAVCGKSGHVKRCARCRNVFYCTREHQLKDWDAHKQTCSKKEQNQNGNQERSLGDNKEQKATIVVSNNDDCRNHRPVSAGTSEENKVKNLPTKAAITDESEKSNIAENTQSNVSASAGFEQPMTKYNEQGEIEFDTRPLKLCEFPKPPSYKTSDIANYAAKNLEKDGYCVVDGILSQAQCENIVKEVKHMDRTGLLKEGKLAGGKTSGVDSEKVVNKNIRSDKVAWLQGTETGQYPAVCQLITEKMDDIVYGMRRHFGEKFLLNGRTKMMVACYPGDGTFYRRHVDNPRQDGRLITCIMYLNKDWNVEKHGGVLRIFPTMKPGDYVDVAPVLNRLLLFWSDGRNPHEVQPAYATRYAITSWFYDEIERTMAKESQINKELHEIEAAIIQADVKKKELEKATLAQKLENEVHRAVALLSEEEIQVMKTLLQSQPDGKSMLLSMGVCENIIDYLLKKV